MQALADLDGVQVSWPDKDLDFTVGGARLESSGTLITLQKERFGSIRGIALAYDTDWDFVRIRNGSSGDAQLLGPRRVLHYAPGEFDGQLKVESAFAVPSTRLYNAQLLAKYQGQKPDAAPAGRWVIQAADQFFKTLDGSLPLYYWSQGAWRQRPVGNDGPDITAPGAVEDSGMKANANDNVITRPADVSPDGVWSFADYMEAGFVIYDSGATAAGVAYISGTALDSRGQPGSNGLATTITYALGSNRFSDMPSLFYGKLSLELWTDEDCPPHGYLPRLAPVRYVSLAAIAHAGGAAAPDTPIVTVPAANVERAQWLGRNTGAGNVFAQLVQPRAEDWIDQVNGVADIDPASGNPFATIANAADGAVYLEEPAGPYVKLVIGADGGGATVAARSVLSLVRRAA